MQLVLCVDMDDDIGRKTDLESPLIGREAVEAGAVDLARADPEDSDVNVLFKGLQLADRFAKRGPVEVAAVTGNAGRDVAAARAVGQEVDTVLESLGVDPDSVGAIVVTDGAQDESVIPVIRSRVTVDGIRRVVVRQAEDLESIYYTLKQVLNDPETRGTILVPLGILLLIYPIAMIASQINLPGLGETGNVFALVAGMISTLLGLYLLARGFDLPSRGLALLKHLRRSLYAGRVTLITYSVAIALVVVAGISAIGTLEAVREGTPDDFGAVTAIAALIDGALIWLAAAGIMTSLGQITDAYLHGRFQVRYLNAPFYVVAIAAILHGLSAYVLGDVGLSYMAGVLAAGTVLGLASTLAFAVAESRQRSHAPVS